MSVTWLQIAEECDTRIRELTAVCVNPESTTEAIRAAQAGIRECERMKTLPDRLAATAQQKGNAPKRREY